MIEPVRYHAERLGELGHGEIPGDLARVGLMAVAEQAMAKANRPDRAGQDRRALRRAMPEPRQTLGDLLIRPAGGARG